MSDRVDRFFESVSVAPWVVGVGVAGCLIALELATSIWTGSIAVVLASDDPFGIRDARLRDARLAVVTPLLVGYLLAARRYATLGARTHLEQLRQLLRDPAASAALDQASAPLDLRRARRAAWIGLLTVPLIALSIDRDPGLYLRGGYWIPEHVFNWAFGLMALWNIGWLTSCQLQYARRFSALARAIPRLDLFDRRPLGPFARQGLRSALLALIAIAIISLNAADRAFAWSLGVIGPIALGLAAAALLLPARGVRDRVRRAKREELERVRQAIQGNTDALANSAIAKRAGSVGLVDLLAYRQYVESVREWPFDAPMLGRFALFTLLPLGSWLGGALVERVLGSLLD